MALAGCATTATSPLESRGVVSTQNTIAIFAPQEQTQSGTQINYQAWSEVLRSVVFYMGPSLRAKAVRPTPTTGSRVVYGHDSAFRLEGNRVRFSVLNNEMKEALSEYRSDLERVGNEIDITKLNRNEQLAYWINLHNVIVIDQIAANYPVTKPSRIVFGEARTPLEDAKLVRLKGVNLSLRDIREEIVFRHWSDPKIMYGFYRGEIGGPSIQGIAFTSENVSTLLDSSAREFVNSLRGIDAVNGELRISRIYHEARPFFFPSWPDDLKAHLLTYADDDVREEIASPGPITEQYYETDIADLAGGDTRKGPISPVTDALNGGPLEFGLPPQVQRLMREYDQKMDTLRAQGNLRGRVIIIDEPTEDDRGSEVD